ncbi:glutathione-disulfide reductase [Nostoc sp. T09]|uniref:glutathione-disulfide reductase n=1 Tax=Nostoc sp. T09 TaxID=1932621 RepID=UPI000A39DBC5|nr:glutathione-disulfide reductase [Nostoc sp. T09]OUL36525.1 glutathione-disulfide reductase [Nostoc sp. T09]
MVDYDLFVIGGGSGGLAAAKRAAHYGARVAIAEPSFLGGTCAARGCIPKKLMVYASGFSQLFEDAVGYGWSKPESQFNWQRLIAAINNKIQHLDTVHAKALDSAGVTVLHAKATFIDSHTVEVGERKITADKILIAVGGKAIKPDIPGSEYALISDQMFQLPQQPKHLAIVGGGYIGVEFAAIMQGLGTQVTQIVREETILDKFDEIIRTGVHEGMTQHGVRFLMNTEVKSIEKTPEQLRLSLSNGSQETVDALLIATGRTPNVNELQLENADVEIDRKAIAVNEYSQTSQPHIYAVGDCTNRKQLTPVAIAEGKSFADTVFGNQPHTVRYSNIPSSVFGKPQAAFVGLTELEAKEKLGADNITIYCTKFQPLFYSLTDREQETAMKLVVDKNSDRVLGAHMVGESAAEIIQAAAIAVTAGLTKKDFDATMPLHPTSAEELVTLQITATPEDPIQPCWMAN